jgi:hypothetical protein
MAFSAQEPVEASAPTKLETLQLSYQAARADYYAKLEAMYESGEFTELENPIEEYFDRFKIIAKDKGVTHGDRARAQLWCVENFGQKAWTHPEKVFGSLSKLFIGEYADSDFAVEYCASLRNVRVSSEIKITALKSLSAATTAKKVKAHCMLAMANAYSDNSNQQQTDATVDALLEKYPDSDAAAKAAPLLVKRQLQVGKTAPALGGVDVDGKPRHLKDTRGKVTFVVFWGFW